VNSYRGEQQNTFSLGSRRNIKMTANKFSLHWNDFDTNMTAAFKELREEKDFFDVTIACEDSQIQAHKVILSACSTFFRNVLRRNPHQHPLLYLKGVKYKELLAILNFMYNGEVQVAQEELKQFLATAGDLKVKGLSQKMAIPSHPNTVSMSSPETPENNSSPNPISQKRESTEKEPAKKRLRPTLASTAKQVFTPARTYQQAENNEILEVVPLPPVVKSSPAFKESPKPKTNQATTPRKGRQDRTPAPKILEQCILEADINNVQAPEVAMTKNMKTVTLSPNKGSEKEMNVSKLNHKSLSQVSETVIGFCSQGFETSIELENMENNTTKTYQHDNELEFGQETSSEVYYVNENLLSKVSPTKTAKRSPKKPKTQKNQPTLELNFIERYATVWRCKICQKISSTKFIAMDHREESHPVAMQLK